MHYLMIKPQDMLKVLHTQSVKTLNEYETLVLNFLNRYSEITSTTYLKDLSREVKEKIKEISGETHALKLQGLMLKIRAGNFDKSKENLIEVYELLSDENNYLGVREITIPKGELHNIRYRDKVREEGGEHYYSLTKFQQKFLAYVKDNLIQGTDEIRFRANIKSDVNNIKSQYKVPEIWGVQLQSVIGYLSPYHMISRIQNSLADFENKLEDIRAFQRNYLEEETKLNDLDRALADNYMELIQGQGVSYKDITTKFISDTISWDYKLINEKIGTYVTEYEMLLQMLELEKLGFLGVWHNSDSTVKHLTSNSRYNKVMNEVSRDELLTNENIRFIVDVVQPILEGEVKYLNEI